MRVGRPVQLLALLTTAWGCAFISDDHAAWRADRDGDGVAWTEDCDESNKNVGAPAIWFADKDEDGYGDPDQEKQACEQPEGFVSRTGDCNDQDPLIRPEVDDPCNGVDDDCDEQMDEDAESRAFYQDSDGDGYGDPGQQIMACEQPASAVTDNTDCDDSDPDLFPGNKEVCDGQDNDCDGTVDEDVVDPTIWYVDVDGDGYGDAANTAVGCVQPDGFVTNGDDCDDATTQWRNRGPEEIYYNGIEDNCDETDGDGDQDGDGFWIEGYVELLEVAGKTPLPIPELMGGDCDDTDPEFNPAAFDFPGDGLDQNCDGIDVADADGDGYDAVAAGGDDCDDLDPEVYPGAEELCLTPYDDDCDGDDNDEDAAGCWNFYLDVDADGFGITESQTCLCYPDGAVRADIGLDCDDTDSEIFPGAEEICFDELDSDCDGEVDHPLCGADDAATSILIGEETGDEAGTSLGVLSTGELLVGAPGYDSEEATDVGAIYVLPVDAPGGLTLGSHGERVIGSAASDQLGTAVLGLEDGSIAISAPGVGAAGVVYLMIPTGRSESEASVDRLAEVVGVSDTEDFGTALAAGLLGEDGLYLLVIGAPSRGTDPPLDSMILMIDLDDTGDTYGGITTTDHHEFGTALAVADVDGDGEDDLLIGIPSYSLEEDPLPEHGAIALILGPLSEDLRVLEDAADAIQYGDSGRDRLGAAILSLPDLDGDSIADLAVGAEQAGDTSSADDSGAVYILTDLPVGGSDPKEILPTTTIDGTLAQDRLGEQLIALDVNGDEIQDLVIGAGGVDESGSESGAIYVMLGPILEGEFEITEDADLRFTGSEAGARFGRYLGLAGDVDGDGTDDLLVGAPGAADQAGRVLLLYGSDLPL